MRTKTILLLLSLVFFAYSQTSLKFKTDNEDDIRKLSDSILLNSKHKYKFKSAEYQTENKVYILNYVNESDSTDVVPVYFLIKIVGENKELEIDGKQQYVFYNVTARYLDLFPFWKKFINTNENAENLLKLGATYSRTDNYRLIFSRYSDSKWILSFKEY